MLGLLYSLALLWAIIYAVNKRRQEKPNRLSLPVYGTPRTQASQCQVRLRPLHLIVETTAFNQTHDKFAWTLLRNPVLKDVLKSFYGFGAALGVIGMFCAVGMLVWTTWKLSYLLLATPPAGNGLVKRNATSTPPQSSGLPFYLIVSSPPSSKTRHRCNYTDTRCHYPSRRPSSPFVLAIYQPLFPRIWTCRRRSGVSRFSDLCPSQQLSSVRRDNVPLTSAGASLLVLIPSAFVSISSGTMSRLPAMGRLRVASAGAYHNILFFATILLLERTRFGNRMLAIGYEDISRLGKVVISIDSVRQAESTSNQSDQPVTRRILL